MAKRIALVIASALVVLALPLASSAQAATYPLQFGRVNYDSPGSDTGSNVSLNAEYITIKNTSSSRLSLTGYTVHDAAGHSYTFGTFHLSAGQTVYLHTGTGTNTWQHRYWGKSWYVWNNNGDTAHLHNALGTLRDACSWPGGSPGYKYC